jgi:hypothetical protein
MRCKSGFAPPRVNACMHTSPAAGAGAGDGDGDDGDRTRARVPTQSEGATSAAAGEAWHRWSSIESVCVVATGYGRARPRRAKRWAVATAARRTWGGARCRCADRSRTPRREAETRTNRRRRLVPEEACQLSVVQPTHHPCRSVLTCVCLGDTCA